MSDFEESSSGSDFEPTENTKKRERKSIKNESKGSREKNRKSPPGGNTANKNKRKKVKLVGIEEAQRLVLNCVVDQNRPLSYIIVNDLLKGQVAKTKVLKILEELAENDKIVMKSYKKSKIFHAKQSETNSNETDSITDELKAKSKAMSEAEEKKKSLTQRLNVLRRTATDDEVGEKIKNLGESVRLKGEKVRELKESLKGGKAEREIGKTLIPELRTNLKKRILEWRNRKNVAKRIAETYLGEESTISPAKLFEEIGCETDENANVSLDSIAKQFL